MGKAAAQMVERGTLMRTVPRRFGIPPLLWSMPLLGRQVRSGLIRFERKGQARS